MLAGAIVAGCSHGNPGPTCAPGTMLLRLVLGGFGPVADTITVHADDIGAAVDASFPHTPNPALVGLLDRQDVVITWPQGYPAQHLVNLAITATDAGDIVGYAMEEIRLDDKCTIASAIVETPPGKIPDGF